VVIGQPQLGPDLTVNLFGPGRNDFAVIVLYWIGHAVDPDFASIRFQSEELIER
jgi:hypothetical protein